MTGPLYPDDPNPTPSRRCASSPDSRHHGLIVTRWPWRRAFRRIYIVRCWHCGLQIGELT